MASSNNLSQRGIDTGNLSSIFPKLHSIVECSILSKGEYPLHRKDHSRRTVIIHAPLSWKEWPIVSSIHISHHRHDISRLLSLQVIDQMCRFELLSVLIRLFQRRKHQQNNLTDDQYVTQH